MISRLLIANRGEIACRIIRTARRMGMTAIAVHSDADADAMHVRAADVAVPIGPADAARSYLNIPALIAAAKKTRADAVHPGYGFLSEDPRFARAVARAGMTFVGPPAKAMELAASKTAALRIARELGIPTLQSVEVVDERPAKLASLAARIGYPLLVKAAAGGGGRGMRVVGEKAGLADAYAQAKGEIARNFGKGGMFLERWLQKARHVEVQLMAAADDAVAVIGDRDCSLQRRHQKVIEEAPAPGLTAALRSRLHADAARLATRMGYRGAGTVEFLVSGKEHFFIELNARIQVEHSVTEAAFGVDIVEQQLQVAAGKPVAAIADAPRLHAIEARVCAEDYESGFLPATGQIEEFFIPAAKHARVDTGVQAGERIGGDYDSLMAKVICSGASREQAISRLAETLGQTRIRGVKSNVPFLISLVELAAFRKGRMTTKTLEGEQDQILQDLAAAKRRMLVAAAALFAQAAGNRGFRVNQASAVTLRGSDLAEPIVCTQDSGAWQIQIGDKAYQVGDLEVQEDAFVCTIDGERFAGTIAQAGDSLHHLGMGVALATLTDRKIARAGSGPATADPSSVTAPMNGRICSVAAKQGQKIHAGETIATLESMKMEIAVCAQADGVVARLLCKPGQLVEGGALLASLAVDG